MYDRAVAAVVTGFFKYFFLILPNNIWILSESNTQPNPTQRQTLWSIPNPKRYITIPRHKFSILFLCYVFLIISLICFFNRLQAMVASSKIQKAEAMSLGELSYPGIILLPHLSLGGFWWCFNWCCYKLSRLFRLEILRGVFRKLSFVHVLY